MGFVIELSRNSKGKGKATNGGAISFGIRCFWRRWCKSLYKAKDILCIGKGTTNSPEPEREIFHNSLGIHRVPYDIQSIMANDAHHERWKLCVKKIWILRASSYSICLLWHLFGIFGTFCLWQFYKFVFDLTFQIFWFLENSRNILFRLGLH